MLWKSGVVVFMIMNFFYVKNRNFSNRRIFKTDRHCQELKRLLVIASEKYDVNIHAYCIVQNNFHLLVEDINNNLFSALQFIFKAYTCWFNACEGTGGQIFTKGSEMVNVGSLRYLLRLSKYIHVQPLGELVYDISKLDQYEWSSYADYLFSNLAPTWLYTDAVLSNFFGRNPSLDYRLYVEEEVPGTDALGICPGPKLRAKGVF
jgi:putative transposase